jgi:hypothetical protein
MFQKQYDGWSNHFTTEVDLSFDGAAFGSYLITDEDFIFDYLILD